MMLKMKHTPHLVLGTMLIWYLLIQLLFSVYRATELVSQRAGGNISVTVETLHSVLLFLPFLIIIIIIMKRGTGTIFINEMRDMNRRYYCGYLFYIFVILFLLFNFMEGVLYMEGRWIGPAIWLDRSMTSYVVLELCHLIFAEFSSVLYLAVAPLLCQAMKAEKGYQLCGSLS